MNLCNLVKQVTVQVLTGQIRSFLGADNNTRDRSPPLRAAILAEPSEFANKPRARVPGKTFVSFVPPLK
jgi:hypothetical protein